MAQVKFKGEEITLGGNFPTVGSKAPALTLVAKDLSEKTLDDFSGRKILSIFPSLDTPVCEASIKTFHEKCGNSTVINVSLDLPFAAKRFCEMKGVGDVVFLSAFRSTFPDDYGVKMQNGPLKGLCARAVLVLDDANNVVYTEIVPDVATPPNYEEAIKNLSQ